MRTWPWALLVAFLVVPEVAQAQRVPQIKYYFQDDSGVLYVDSSGKGQTPVALFVEFSQFICVKPVEFQIELHFDPVEPAWANATLIDPAPVTLIPPGPSHGTHGQATHGTFRATWDTRAAPIDVRQEYVVRARLVEPDLSACGPRPMVVQGGPSFWNLTVCREPQHGGLGAGCKEVLPRLLPPRGAPGVGILGLIVAAAVLTPRRR